MPAPGGSLDAPHEARARGSLLDLDGLTCCRSSADIAPSWEKITLPSLPYKMTLLLSFAYGRTMSSTPPPRRHLRRCTVCTRRRRRLARSKPRRCMPSYRAFRRRWWSCQGTQAEARRPRPPSAPRSYRAGPREGGPRERPTARFRKSSPDTSASPDARTRVLVPKVGLEPTRPCGRRILSPLRLPFRHFGSLQPRKAMLLSPHLATGETVCRRRLRM